MEKITIAAILIGTALLSVNLPAKHNSEESVLARLAKVGTLNIADETSQPSENVGENEAVVLAAADGLSVYNSACIACHAAGIAGAPRVGDKEEWAKRADQGFDTLLKHSIEGKGAMPARGGRSDLNDEDIAAAVQYMLDNSQ